MPLRSGPHPLAVGDPALPVPATSPGQVREAIDAILARPELTPEPRSLLERAWAWVLERVDDLLNAVFGAGGGSAVGWAVVAVLTLAAVALAVRFSTRLRRDPVLADAAGGSARRSVADWRADADAHEAAGDWRAALRCRWRALVADLAGRGVVEEVPGRTAGEYRRQVAAAVPSAASDFDAATELFEGAWYGDRPADASQAERLRSLSERVLAGAGSSS